MVRLTIHRPDRLPESFSYTEPVEISVGRSLNCTCCLESDPMASRLHAVILIDPPMVRIKDLNSTNGLVLNGQRIGSVAEGGPSPAIALRDGDEVFVGQTRIVVNLLDQDGRTALGNSDTQDGITVKPAEQGFHTAPAAETVNASSMPPVAGYRLIRILALALTGSVYLGLNEADGANVAIKILSPEIPFSRKTLDDFRHEIDSARAIDHPNLARLLGAGELERGGMYLVMEYVEGDDLGAYLRRVPDGRLPLKLAHGIMLQLAGAVCYFHSHGFVHMDIKPASIIMHEEKGKLRPKITDQGFARFLDETGILPRGYAGQDTERLACLPPEELTPMAEPKATADVFSLCAVFYRLLTGSIPYNFSETGDNREKVEKGMIVPIEERLPGLPEPLVVIIERGLALEPEARYQSGCDLLEALENIGL